MHVGIAYLRWRGKRSRHSRRMRTRKFAYLARGPCSTIKTLIESQDYCGMKIGCHLADVVQMTISQNWIDEWIGVALSDNWYGNHNHIKQIPQYTCDMCLRQYGPAIKEAFAHKRQTKSVIWDLYCEFYCHRQTSDISTVSRQWNCWSLRCS